MSSKNYFTPTKSGGKKYFYFIFLTTTILAKQSWWQYPNFWCLCSPLILRKIIHRSQPLFRPFPVTSIRTVMKFYFFKIIYSESSFWWNPTGPANFWRDLPKAVFKFGALLDEEYSSVLSYQENLERFQDLNPDSVPFKQQKQNSNIADISYVRNVADFWNYLQRVLKSLSSLRTSIPVPPPPEMVYVRGGCFFSFRFKVISCLSI